MLDVKIIVTLRQLYEFRSVLAVNFRKKFKNPNVKASCTQCIALYKTYLAQTESFFITEFHKGTKNRLIRIDQRSGFESQTVPMLSATFYQV